MSKDKNTDRFVWKKGDVKITPPPKGTPKPPAKPKK